MVSPPSRKRAKIRKDVHFFFASHPPGEKYLPTRTSFRGTKTHLVENAGGGENFDGVKAESSHYRSSRMKLFDRLRKMNIRLATGESDPEDSLLDRPNRSTELYHLTHARPTVENIKHFFLDRSDWNIRRHENIRGNIEFYRGYGGWPLTGRYGGLHSLLTQELKKDGIISSREIQPQLFGYDIELTRRLMRGEDPSKISPQFYKRAFATTILGLSEIFIYQLTGKLPSNLNHKAYERFNLILRTMISRLSEDDLDHFLRTKNERILFEKNGFGKSNLPSFHKLNQFLRKYSVFYRHQLAFKKIRKSNG